MQHSPGSGNLLASFAIPIVPTTSTSSSNNSNNNNNAASRNQTTGGSSSSSGAFGAGVLGAGVSRRRNLWDVGATPTPLGVGGAGMLRGGFNDPQQTPSFAPGKWDQTPQHATPIGATPRVTGAVGGTMLLLAAGGQQQPIWAPTPLGVSAANQMRGGTTPGSGSRDDAAQGGGHQQPHVLESRFGGGEGLTIDTSFLADLAAEQQRIAQQMAANSGDGSAGGAAAALSSVTQHLAQVQDEFERLSVKEQMMVQRIVEAQRYLSDEEIDAMLPPGYATVARPADIAASIVGSAVTASASAAAAASSGTGVDAAVAAAAQQATEAKRAQQRRLDMPADGIISPDLPPLNIEDALVFRLLIEYRNTPDSDIPAEHIKKVQVLRSLLRFKNGKPPQRKAGTRDLINRAKVYYTAEDLVGPIVGLWRSDGILQDDLDRHRVVKLLGLVVLQFRGALQSAQVRQVLMLVQPMLSDADPFAREEGREILAALVKAAGLEEMVLAVRHEIDDERTSVRSAAAQTIALVAETLGVEPLLRLIGVLCRSKKNTQTRETGGRIVSLIAQSRVGVTCRRYLPELVSSITELLRTDSPSLKISAAVALQHLADASRPVGYEAFVPSLNLVRDAMRSAAQGKQASFFLRCLASIVVLMPPREAYEQAVALSDPLQRAFASPDEDVRRVALVTVDHLLSCEGAVTPEFLHSQLLMGFLSMWTPESFVERKTGSMLLKTTAHFAKRIAGRYILATLRERLEQDAPQMEPGHYFVRSLCHGVKMVAEVAALDDVPDEELRSTFDALLDALNRDRGAVGGATSPWLEDTIGVFCEKAAHRFAALAPKLIRIISQRLGDKKLGVRRQAAELLSRTAKTIGFYSRGSIESLRDAWTDLDERIVREHNAVADTDGNNTGSINNNSKSNSSSAPVTAASTVASGLKACTVLLDAWCTSPGRENQMRVITEAAEHVTKLFSAVQAALKSPAIRNDDMVQERCVRAVLGVVALCEREIAVARPEDLFTVAVDSLLMLLHAKRRSNRSLTAQAFGRVANLIGPLHIIKQLIDKGIRKEDQRLRLCASVALAVVAKSCRPFVVIPFLVYEYEQCKGTDSALTVQHAVLKCLRFLFEHIAGDDDAVQCVYAVLPLLERALTERFLQHRRMACEAVREMMLACAGGVDAEGTLRPVWVHLMNFVMPTLLEPIGAAGKENKKAVSVVVECVEAAQLVLPPGQVLQLLVQGMFHPKRAVRDIYWSTYNILAIRAGEAMVPCCPAVADEDDDDDDDGDTADKVAAMAVCNYKRDGQYRRHMLEVIV